MVFHALIACFAESYRMEKNTLQCTQAWSQTWDEEAVAGVHYKTMKGHLFLGVRARVSNLPG